MQTERPPRCWAHPRALQERGISDVGSALLLGGGATAASLGWALAELGCREVHLLARNPTTVRETVAVIERHPGHPEVVVSTLSGSASLSRADVVASTIPATAQVASILTKLEDVGAQVIFDAIYDPWPTPLAGWATQRGIAVVSGLDLLVHQAALQVELMTGQLPAIEPMRAAGLSTLEARSQA